MLPVFNLWRITPRYWEYRFCTSQEPTVWKTDASYNLFVSFAAARAGRRGALRDSGPSGCERDNWQLMCFTRLLTIRKIVYRRKGDIQPVFRDTWNYCHPFLYFHSIFISITYRLRKTTLLFPICLFLIYRSTGKTEGVYLQEAVCIESWTGMLHSSSPLVFPTNSKIEHFFTALSTLLRLRKHSFSLKNNKKKNKNVSNPLTTIFTQFSSDHTKPCKNTYLRIRTSGFNYLLAPVRIKTIGLYLQKTLPSRAVF